MVEKSQAGDTQSTRLDRTRQHRTSGEAQATH
jgi:hypothetical protein